MVCVNVQGVYVWHVCAYMYRVCVFLGVSMIYVCVHMGSLYVCGYMGCVYIDMVYVCVYVCVYGISVCAYVWYVYGVCVCVYVWGLCVCPGCVCMCLCVFLCMYVGWVRIDVLNEPLPRICKLCVSVWADSKWTTPPESGSETTTPSVHISSDLRSEGWSLGLAELKEARGSLHIHAPVHRLHLMITSSGMFLFSGVVLRDRAETHS